LEIKDETGKYHGIFNSVGPRTFSEKSKLFIAKLMMGAAADDFMSTKGKISFSLTRPLAAYIDLLYMDESLRIMRGGSGTIFAFARTQEGTGDDLSSVDTKSTAYTSNSDSGHADSPVRSPKSNLPMQTPPSPNRIHRGRSLLRASRGKSDSSLSRPVRYRSPEHTSKWGSSTTTGTQAPGRGASDSSLSKPVRHRSPRSKWNRKNNQTTADSTLSKPVRHQSPGAWSKWSSNDEGERGDASDSSLSTPIRCKSPPRSTTATTPQASPDCVASAAPLKMPVRSRSPCCPQSTSATSEPVSSTGTISGTFPSSQSAVPTMALPRRIIIG
jgi:hypothetical protein